jgi:ABC-type amino acid transport substrate-binding protein
MKHRLFACILMLIALSAHAAFEITTPITDYDKDKLDRFLRDRTWSEVSSYAGLDSGGLVEQALFRRAIVLGGLDARFIDFIVPNSARARESIRSGMIVGGGPAVWQSYCLENAEHVLQSDVLIPDGQFEKGLYALPQKLPKIRKVADLRKLTVVSTQSWQVDWNTLEHFAFAKRLSVPTKDQQFKMVQSGWADVLLHDFANTPDMGVEIKGVRLLPAPGVKIALAGSRHFIISKKHPDGQKVFKALQKGLKIMQKNGEIERAFMESGFYNQTARNWLLLKPE